MKIEAVTSGDYPFILGLNREWVHYLSPLDEARLAWLDGMAAYHRIVRVDEEPLAFLLALGPGCEYDSSNYRWFDRHYSDFIYIDRVVVATRAQGRGLGRELYRHLIGHARACQIPRVACEFDLQPPNEASRRFHESFGFRPVGDQGDPNTGKQVSLQVLTL